MVSVRAQRRPRLSMLLAVALSGCASPAPVPTTAPAEPTHESQPEPPSEVLTDAPAIPNSAEALAARLEKITAIEISDGEKILASLDEAQLAAVVGELADGDVGGLSMTSPPWPGYSVLLHVDGRSEPFVASVVALGGLRLNARDPGSASIADADGAPDLDNIAELGPSDTMWDVMIALVGPTESKENQRPPRRAR